MGARGSARSRRARQGLQGRDQATDPSSLGDLTILRSFEKVPPLNVRAQAAAANEAKSTFLTTMSHQICMPMNSVLGMMRSWSGSGLGDEHPPLVATMLVSAQALLRIIDDVLNSPHSSWRAAFAATRP
jgi:signal transduction histidine kinase